MADARRETWITGIGIVSCLGEGPDAHWQRLNEPPPQPDVRTIKAKSESDRITAASVPRGGWFRPRQARPPLRSVMTFRGGLGEAESGL